MASIEPAPQRAVGQPVAPGTPTQARSAPRTSDPASTVAVAPDAVDLSGDAIGLGVPAQIPMLLLPLRIETRFANSSTGPELWVRIFPDQISIDSHDPTLSSAEWSASQQYWQAMWPLTLGDTAGQQQAWAELASAFGPRRAAYVAKVTAPAQYAAWVTAGDDTKTLGAGGQLDLAQPGALRATSWERAPVARLLPETWFVALYRNRSVAHCVGVNRSAEDPVVGLTPPSPMASQATPPADPTAPMKWMLDFDAAVAAGMGVRIPITAEEAQIGFDEVVVVGATRDSKTETLAMLLTAHRYTDGFGLVPQGTPTKNSDDGPSGYKRTDPNYLKSFSLERQGPLIDIAATESTQFRDGHFFADALGLDREVVSHTEHADGLDQQDALDMANVLWPVTGGYSLPYMFGYDMAWPAAASSAMAEQFRQFATTWVKGRGPLPALRVGTIPYGVLPVVSIDGPEPLDGTTQLFEHARRLINAARPTWLASVPDVTIAANGADESTASVLGMTASSCRYAAGVCFGPSLEWNLGLYDLEAGAFAALSGASNLEATLLSAFGEGYLAAGTAATAATAAQLAAAGLPPAAGPAGGLVLQSVSAYDLPFVVPTGEPLSETTPLQADYVVGATVIAARLGGTTHVLEKRGNYFEYLAAQNVSGLLADTAAPTVLLRLAHQAVLLEYAAVAGSLLGTRLQDPEFQSIAGPGPMTDGFLWALQNTTYPASGGAPLGDYIQSQLSTAAGQAAYPTLAAICASLDALAQRPTAALARAASETLDAWSYRLDAWWTGLASMTLSELRARDRTGLLVGAYGYVEGAAPAPAPLLEAGVAEQLRQVGVLAAPDPKVPGPFAPGEENGGFVYGPSLSHATTAAILRNGYLSQQGGASGTALSIDISSARVRDALQLMKGVREGQHLGALLGYQFERALLDGGDLAQYIPVFRDLYPIVAGKLTPGGPAESVAASNVVDGAALQQASFEGRIPWGGALPGPGTSDFDGLTAALDLLDQAVDAHSDLSTAESLFQIVRGNPTRSGGALDTSSRDQHAPDPQIIETPRAGLDFTQRLLSWFNIDPANPPPSKWLGDQPSTPRASAEPYLESWLCAVLPSPSSVEFELAYTAPAPGSAPATTTVSLTQAGLSALDVIALAPPPASPSAPPLAGAELGGSELERWIVATCTANAVIPVDSRDVKVTYDRASLGNPALTLPELLLLVRALQELLGTARPLEPADLVPAPPPAEMPAVDVAEMANRMVTARTGFTNLATQLNNTLSGLSATPTSNDADALATLLLTASAYGEPNAAPLTIGRDQDAIASIVGQAQAVSTRLALRLAALQSDLTQGGQDLLTAPGVTLASVKKAGADLFGVGFMLLPTVTPAAGDPLTAALGEIATAFTAWASEPSATRTGAAQVLQQMTHIRPGVARADECMTLSAALAAVASPAPTEGSRVADLKVAQLPPDPSGLLWYGLTTPGQAPWSPAVRGACALLQWAPDSLASAGRALCGLFLDDWTEQIPSATQSTAIALNYQEPTARAPQTLILGLAPGAEVWSVQGLIAIVRETATFGRVRTVDPDNLSGLGQVLPAVFTAFNPAGLTISTQFSDLSEASQGDKG